MSIVNLHHKYTVDNTLTVNPNGHTMTDYTITTTGGNTTKWVAVDSYANSPFIPVESVVDLIEDGHVHLKSGEEVYVRGGKLHREDGPALINESQGIKRWFLKGKELYKNSFKTIEKVNAMQAWELFTPVEIAEMRVRAIETNKTKKELNL